MSVDGQAYSGAPSFFDGFSLGRWPTLIENLKSNNMQKVSENHLLFFQANGARFFCDILYTFHLFVFKFVSFPNDNGFRVFCLLSTIVRTFLSLIFDVWKIQKYNSNFSGKKIMDQSRTWDSPSHTNPLPEFS